MRLRLATRKSPLAMVQAEMVRKQLQDSHPDLEIVLVGIQTTADKMLNTPLQSIGGKGLFVKALQNALLENEADIAVHCIKDMSVHEVEGLTLSAILPREDARDVWVSSQYKTIEDLPEDATIGTSSPRRISLLKSLRPDVNTKLCRGNVNTRLQKCEAGEFDGLILAAAGLNRLGMQAVVSDFFDPTIFIPAIGQGALGIECRSDDTNIIGLLKPLHCHETAQCITAEREVNRVLHGDCHTAIGAHAVLENGELHLRACVGDKSGHIIRAETRGLEAIPLGNAVADLLLKQGARKMIAHTDNDS